MEPGENGEISEKVVLEQTLVSLQVETQRITN